MIVELVGTTTSEIEKRLVSIREEGGVVALGRVLTLVVHTQLGEEEAAIEAANLASREHPMRVLVVSRNRDEVRLHEEARLDAEIRVGGDAGASEVVLLRCFGEVGSHLLGVVQGLLLPDAPTVAWWPSFMPEIPAHSQLGQIAQRRITDLLHQEDARASLQLLAEGYAAGDTDLAWTRLTNWRAHLATLLDQPPYEPVLSATVCGDIASPSVHLMGSWLRLTLQVPVTVLAADPDAPLGSSGLAYVSLERPSGTSSLRRTEPAVGVLTQPGQPEQRIALSRRGLQDQLAEELRRLDPDDMYRQVLQALAAVGSMPSSAPTPED